MKVCYLLLLSLLIMEWRPVEPPDKPRALSAVGDTKVLLQSSDSGPAKAALVRGPGFLGVIFPANTKAIRGLYPKGVSFWTPTEADVLTAEKGLVPFLKGLKDPRIPDIVKQIKEYKRQYRGIVVNGQKQISIRFLCEAFGSDWTKEELIVSDGGSCFFNLRFSPKTNTFSDLQINGFA